MSINYYNSFFNPNIQITRDQSAVTLACALRNDRPTRHAQIWIERINENGEFKRFYIDLNGPGSHEQARRNVAVNGCSSNAVMYSTSAVIYVKDTSNISRPRVVEGHYTWSCSSSKVQEMVNAAKLEANNPIAHPRAFSIFGSKSIFSFKSEAFQTSEPFLQALLKTNKSLFKWMYETAKATLEKYPVDTRYRYPNIIDDPNFIPWRGMLWGENGVWLLDVAIKELESEIAFTERNTYSNDMGGSDEVEQSVYWNQALSEYSIQVVRNALRNAYTPNERQLVIQNIEETFRQLDFQGLIPYNVPYYSIFESRDSSGIAHGKEFARKVIERMEKKNEEYKSLIKKHFNKSPVLTRDENRTITRNFSNEKIEESEGDYLVLYRTTLKLIAENTDLRSLTPDNCFTWARDKLRIAEIDIQERGSDRFWANARDYLDFLAQNSNSSN